MALGTPPSPIPPDSQRDDPLAYRRNWGRWGENDQMGSVNLITPEKRVQAAALVKTGRAVSFGRPLRAGPVLFV
jgi:hypothetical protein